MKKQKRKEIFVSIVNTKALLSASTDAEEGEERKIHVLDDGSGYKASINGEEIGHAKEIPILFGKIFDHTHKKDYFHDLVLGFPQEERLSYATMHTGQIRIVRDYGLSKEEIDKFWMEFFRAVKEERN